MTSTTTVRGWPIVGWASLALGVMVGGLLAAWGTGEDGIRVVIRATARTSVLLFVLAFTAAALRRAWRSAATAWLLANRRYLGVSFAVSHLIHLLAIFALAGWSPAVLVEKSGATTLAFGGLAYVFLAAMTATSFDRTAAWLGPRRWRRLHLAGAWWIWLIFFVSYVPRALASPAYAPLALLVVAAAALRLWARAPRPVPVRVATS